MVPNTREVVVLIKPYISGYLFSLRKYLEARFIQKHNIAFSYTSWCNFCQEDRVEQKNIYYGFLSICAALGRRSHDKDKDKETL
jgi:hypothetical protein